MAADSQLSQNTTKLTTSNPKITRLGPLLIGIDGSLVMGDAVRYHSAGLNLTELGDDLPGWLSRELVPWMRAYLKAADLMNKQDDGHEFPGSIMVAHRSQFLHIDCAGSVALGTSPWWAIGSGGAVARGAMLERAAQEHLDACEVAVAGVAAACELDMTCSEPIHHLWTEP